MTTEGRDKRKETAPLSVEIVGLLASIAFTHRLRDIRMFTEGSSKHIQAVLCVLKILSEFFSRFVSTCHWLTNPIPFPHINFAKEFNHTCGFDKDSLSHCSTLEATCNMCVTMMYEQFGVGAWVVKRLVLLCSVSCIRPFRSRIISGPWAGCLISNNHGFDTAALLMHHCTSQYNYFSLPTKRLRFLEFHISDSYPDQPNTRRAHLQCP